MRSTYGIFSALMLGVAVTWVPAADAIPAAVSVENCSIVPAIPELQRPVTIKVDAADDNTTALQEALDRLKPNERVRLAPGIYRISKALILRVPGVQLHGAGATLFSSSAEEGGLTIQADDVGIFDLTLDQDSRTRQSTPWAGGIAIYDARQPTVRAVRGAVIQHNQIKHAAAAGIFAYRAERFLIAGNTVWRSLADGIHVTAGSSDGRIIGNRISQTGDDMIAVVSYAGDTKVSSANERYRDWSAVRAAVNRNILIADNEVSDQYWGRGISIVGGEQLTLSDNVISRSPVAAGIYIERESSFKTYGVHDVLVRDNRLSRIQTNPPQYQPHADELRLTEHGAIEIGSSQDADELSDARYRRAFSIDRVSLVDNEIDQARFAGIRAGVGTRNTVTNLLVRGNAMSEVAQHTIVDAGEGLERTSAQCVANRLGDVLWPRGCDRVQASGASVAVNSARGFTLRCDDSGASLPRRPAAH